jgi:hypothetical protein
MDRLADARATLGAAGSERLASAGIRAWPPRASIMQYFVTGQDEAVEVEASIELAAGTGELRPNTQCWR